MMQLCNKLGQGRESKSCMEYVAQPSPVVSNRCMPMTVLVDGVADDAGGCMFALYSCSHWCNSRPPRIRALTWYNAALPYSLHEVYYS